MKSIYFGLLVVASTVIAPLFASAAYSQYFGNKIFATDSDVYSIVEGPDGTVYIGGAFSEVSQYVGHGLPVNSDGDIDIPKLKPVIDSSNTGVLTVVSDGDDGWYIGGHFQAIGDITVTNLAHILKTGELDENFNPVFNGNVNTLVLDGTTLYVGGAFTDIDGTTRNRLAALNTTTGLVTDFNPNVGGTVWSLAVEGTTLYAGGAFTTVNGGTTRNYLAAFDTTTGTATSFDPNMNNTVFAIESSGTTLYTGGSFTTVNGGTTRNRLAAFTLADGSLAAFDPGASAAVSDIDLIGETLYVTGSFSTLAGQTRNLAGAVNVTDSTATNFNPNLAGTADEIVLYDSTAYIGGSMGTINGVADFRYFAAFDASTGVVSDLDLELDRNVTALAVDDDGTVYVGGRFVLMHPIARNNIAAFDAETGQPTDFNPNMGNYVNSLVLDGTTLYAGGGFTTVNGGTPRNRLAALDTTTGLATDFNPNMGGVVDEIILDGTTLYVAGSFTSGASASRRRLAAIDVTTGLATSFDPSMDNEVSDIVLDGTTLYAAGFFTQVNSTTTPVARNRIAAIDTATGLPTAWNPGMVGTFVLDMDQTDTSVFVGGRFTSIGGDTRYAIAEIDKATASSTAFSVSGFASGGQAQVIDVKDGVVYAGVSDNTYYGVAGFDIETSEVVLDPQADYDSGWGILATDNYLYFHGEIPGLFGRFPLLGEEDYIEGLPLSVVEEPPAEEEEEEDGGGSGSRRRVFERQTDSDVVNVTLEQLQTQLIELLKQLLQILLAQQH